MLVDIMLCNYCTNNQSIKTGIPSCMLPHCNKDINELAKRLSEIWDSKEDFDERFWIRQEIHRKKAK